MSLPDAFEFPCQRLQRQTRRCHFTAINNVTVARALVSELLQLTGATSVICMWGFNSHCAWLQTGRNTQARCHRGQIQVCLLGKLMMKLLMLWRLRCFRVFWRYGIFGATIEPFGDSQRGSAGSCREPQFGASSAVAEPDERGQRLTWF